MDGRTRLLSPRPLGGSGWRRALGVRGWLRSRIELAQRRTQRIEARRVRKTVDGYGAPDCRCHRGKLVVGEVNCRHGPCPTPSGASTRSGVLGRQLVAPIGKLFKAEIASEVLARSILVGIPLLTL